MWDLSSLTRAQTHTPLHWKHTVLTTVPLGKSLGLHFFLGADGVFESCTWEEMIKRKSLTGVQLFATPFTVACQAPWSMEFSR